jgi:drug/metabolite transporter (DMT)-like permease
MTRGLIFAFFAFGFYACGDALIKAAGATTTVFTIAFFVTLASLIPVLYARPADERWSRFMVMRHPWLTQLRALCGVFAGMSGFYAFANLPLAEAYTLLFMMPVWVTVLSVLVLKEKIGWRRWTALAIGLTGVIVVIRPGFQAITPAHFAALAAGFCGAVAMIVVRQIGASEKRTSLMGMSLLYALAANGVLMVLNGFALPDTLTLGMLSGAGILHGTATLLLLFASQLVPANRIAPVQYSQLIWGVALGWLFFAETPDAIAMVGLALVALSGLATFIREDVRGFWPRNFRDVRNRF